MTTPDEGITLKSEHWKWIATALIGALLGGVPAYFALAAAAVTPDQVRAIIEREYHPAILNTYQEVHDLRGEVLELQKSNAAMSAKLDMLIRRYALNTTVPLH